ncbi:Uma2 family endonuclease [Thiohalocapsa halophila]
MTQPVSAESAPPRQTDAPATEPAGPIEPRSEAGKRVSEETYWTRYYLEADIQYEWNDGVLEEKPVSDFETYCIYVWLLRLLDTFLKAEPLGKLVGLEMGFRLPLPNKVVIRKPDLAVVRNDNPGVLLPVDVAYHGVYDLCIEALSTTKPAHIHRDRVQKHGEYAAGGVPEYYILHADPERRAFYSRNDSGLYEPIPPQDGVIHSRALPGFRFRLADLLAQPADEALRDDPIYADFVLAGWRADRERAEGERLRAEAERVRAQAAEREAEQQRRRAEQERRRAEELAARLRMLGQDPDTQAPPDS